MKKQIFFLTTLLATVFVLVDHSYAIEGQIKEIKFVASPGQLVGAVLDEIDKEDLKSLNPVPAKCIRCYQDYTVSQAKPVKLHFKDMEYLLQRVRFRDNSLREFESMVFVEPKTQSQMLLIFAPEGVKVSLGGHTTHAMAKVVSRY